VPCPPSDDRRTGSRLTGRASHKQRRVVWRPEFVAYKSTTPTYKGPRDVLKLAGTATNPSTRERLALKTTYERPMLKAALTNFDRSNWEGGRRWPSVTHLTVYLVSSYEFLGPRTNSRVETLGPMPHHAVPEAPSWVRPGIILELIGQRNPQ
jgi:hypothetical protein